MHVPQQGHAVILSSFNLFSENLDHCMQRLLAEAFRCSQTGWGYVDEKKLLEKRRSGLFYGWVKAVAIKVMVDVLLRIAASFTEVSIYSDSRARILAPSSLTVRSRLFKEHLSSLEIASPSLSGNCRANEISKEIGPSCVLAVDQ